MVRITTKTWAPKAVQPKPKPQKASQQCRPKNELKLGARVVLSVKELAKDQRGGYITVKPLDLVMIGQTLIGRLRFIGQIRSVKSLKEWQLYYESLPGDEKLDEHARKRRKRLRVARAHRSDRTP